MSISPTSVDKLEKKSPFQGLLMTLWVNKHDLLGPLLSCAVSPSPYPSRYPLLALFSMLPPAKPTSSEPEPKMSRSKGMAATMSMRNQPLK